MRNKFNAICAGCGRTVLAGEGDTNKNDAGRWVTKHNACPAVPVPHGRAFVGGFGSFSGVDAEDECFELYGMTEADFRDAVNPDEGDKW